MGSSTSSSKQIIEVPVSGTDEPETKIEKKNLSDGYYISDMFGPHDDFIQIKFDGTTLFQRKCTVEYGTVSIFTFLKNPFC